MTTEITPIAIAHFKFADAILFKKLLDRMRTLQDELTLKIENDYFEVRHLDPSRVAMFTCKIQKEIFEEWNVTKTGYCAFNVEQVLKVAFTNLQKETAIEFEVTDPKYATFRLKDKRTREKSFATLDPSTEEIPHPKIEWASEYKIAAKELFEDIQDLTKVSDHTILHGTNEFLELKATGDTVKGKTTYNRGDDLLVSIECREESTATFSLSYLEQFIDSSMCNVVSIMLRTDMPLKMVLYTKFGDLIYYLAPRIDTDT
jgi:proliferating cell nuclear antigen PCNA